MYLLGKAIMAFHYYMELARNKVVEIHKDTLLDGKL